MNNDPIKLSIISPSYNTGKYAVETIESIMSQTFKSWEHIVIDNESTDCSRDVFKKYPHIKLICEKDRSPDEGFRKGLALAKGEYVTFCGISDGYLNNKWYETCIKIMDENEEISLVWGIDQLMNQDSTLGCVPFNDFFYEPPPNGRGYIYYWLNTFTMFHERDLIVRRNVMEECYPHFHEGMIGHESAYLTFMHNFNTSGYLPFFIPVIAAYGRTHENAASTRQKQSGELDKSIEKYYRDAKAFRTQLLKRKMDFIYRDGSGNKIDGEFNKKKYMSNLRKMNSKQVRENLLPPFVLNGFRVAKREMTRLKKRFI